MLKTLLTTATISAAFIATPAFCAVIVTPLASHSVGGDQSGLKLPDAATVHATPEESGRTGLFPPLNEGVEGPAKAVATSPSKDTPLSGSALLIATSIGTMGMVMVRRKERNAQGV